MFNQLWSDLRFRLRAVFRRETVARELDAELQFHLAKETEKYVRDGVGPDEARRLAAVSFGGLNRIKDDTRDAHGVSFIEHLVHDVRYALRGLRARPGFTVVVVGTLALGIGVNAAMFSVIDRVMFRAPAYLIDPSHVNRVNVDYAGVDGSRGFERSLEYPRYVDFAQHTTSFANTAAFAYRNVAVGEGEDTKDLAVGLVSASYFDFFSARPVLGRFFTRAEDTPTQNEQVVVLTYGYWQSHYAGRGDALGALLEIGNARYRVIGVAPPNFEGVSDRLSPVAFVPITAFARTVREGFYREYSWSWLEMLVRRKPGVSVAAANADLTRAYVQSWLTERMSVPELPSVQVAKPVAVASPVQLARGPVAGPDAKVIFWIGGVALVVFLIACANVANLLLARALRRRRELAVRRAIGGTSARLVQQVLTETLVLASIGTIIGLFAAQLVAGALRSIVVDTNGPVAVITDARTVGFAIAIAFIATLLAGLLPALHSARGNLASSLNAGAREGTYRQSRVRGVLLLTQTALSVILLVGAGLFVRSLQNVRAIRLGYDVDRLTYVQVNERGAKLSLVESRLLSDRLASEVRAIPGVSNASLGVTVPFWSTEGRRVYVPGVDSARKLGRFVLQAGSPEYFATFGTRLLSGRTFSADDRANAPRVAVVSDAMARALWKTESALGKCIRVGADTVPCTTVVGVVEDIKTGRITGAREFTYYLPIEQYYQDFGKPPMMTVFARVAGRPDDYVQSLRARLQPLLSGPEYLVIMPMHELIDPSMQSWTSGARMFLALGGLALALAAIGLYAVIAFAVAQRTQELGVRIALGARPSNILRLVVREGANLTLIGVAIGASVALIGGRAISPLLFGISPHDPLVYCAVAALLIAVGVVASAIPAARAARVDPNVALRNG